MPNFKQTLELNKALLAELAAFRLAPAGMVNIRGVDGVWRVFGAGQTGRWIECVKQDAAPIERAKGAAYLPNDRGPARTFEASRLYPVGHALWRP